MFTISQKDAQGYPTLTALSEVQYLASALAKDDARFHVTTIQVRKDRSAVATNGMSLHYIELCSLEMGFYKVIKTTRWSVTLEKVAEEDVCDFPPVDDILAEAKQERGTVDITGLDEDKAEIAYCTVLRAMSENFVNYNLFMTAIKGTDQFDVKFDSSCNKAIYVIADGRMAIVMPFRI